MVSLANIISQYQQRYRSVYHSTLGVASNCFLAITGHLYEAINPNSSCLLRLTQVQQPVFLWVESDKCTSNDLIQSTSGHFTEAAVEVDYTDTLEVAIHTQGHGNESDGGGASTKFIFYGVFKVLVTVAFKIFVLYIIYYVSWYQCTKSTVWHENTASEQGAHPSAITCDNIRMPIFAFSIYSRA